MERRREGGKVGKVSKVDARDETKKGHVPASEWQRRSECVRV